MPVKEIARELQGKAANLALRMPISWINILGILVCLVGLIMLNWKK
jgi:hypothetical protein